MEKQRVMSIVKGTPTTTNQLTKQPSGGNTLHNSSFNTTRTKSCHHSVSESFLVDNKMEIHVTAVTNTSYHMKPLHLLTPNNKTPPFMLPKMQFKQGRAYRRQY
jgi:hypothetical protein